MDVWDKYKDKKVVVFKIDGFTKIGYLRGVEANFIFLEFLNGEFKTVPRNEISGIEYYKENGGSNG